MARVTIFLLLGLMCAMVLGATPKKDTKTRGVCDWAARYGQAFEKKCVDQCLHGDAYKERDKAYRELQLTKPSKSKQVATLMKKYCKNLKTYYKCKVACGGNKATTACNVAFAFKDHRQYIKLISRFSEKAKKMFKKCLPNLKNAVRRVPNKRPVCDRASNYTTQKKENQCAYSCNTGDKKNYQKMIEMKQKLSKRSGEGPEKVAEWATKYCSYKKNYFRCKAKCGGSVASYFCNLAFRLEKDTSDYRKFIRKLPKKAKGAKKILKKCIHKLKKAVGGAPAQYGIQHKGLLYTAVAMMAMVVQSLFLMY